MRILFGGTAIDYASLSRALTERMNGLDAVLADATETFIKAVSTDVFDALVVDAPLYEDPDAKSAIRESSTVALVISHDDIWQNIDPTHDVILTNDPLTAVAEIAARLDHAVRRQEELQRFFQRSEIASQAVHDIVYRLDESGHFTYLNSSISRLGYDESELIGKHFTKLLDERTADRVSREAVLPSFRGVTTGPGEAPKLFDERRRGSRRTSELAVMLQPGRPRANDPVLGYVTASGDIVTRSDGTTEVVGTIGVIRNVGVVEDGVELLRKMYAAADSSQTGMLLTDAELRVQYANPSFYRLSSLSPDDVLGVTIDELNAEGFGSSLFEEVDYAVKEEIVVEHEYTVEGLGGRPIGRLITARPVYDAGRRCEGVVLVVQPADLRDDLNLPESIDAIVERGVNAFRRESGGSTDIMIEHGDRLLSVQSDPAGYLFSAVRDLLILCAIITDGGTVRVRTTASDDGIRLFVDGKSDRNHGERSDVSGRMQAALARTEALRAELREFGGTWKVDRREHDIEFMLSIPTMAAQSTNGRPLYVLGPFLASYHDNPVVMEEILRLFDEEVPERIRAIEAGIEGRRFAAVADAAHSLANTCGTLQSASATHAARRLESAARSADVEGCALSSASLVREVEAMLSAVRDHRAKEQQ